jgi:hypothetical protein
METRPLPLKGGKIQAYGRRSGPLSKEDLYRTTPTVTRELGFSGLIRKTAHLFASYYTLGDVEDVF